MSRSISDLHPLVQGLCRRHVAVCSAEGIELLITSTYRSIEEQDELYAQGRTKPGKIVTNARGGYSWHNFRAAYDVVPLVGGKAVWNDLALWQRVGEAGVKVGLEWGGDWPRFKDRPHFQWTGGLTLKEMREGASLPSSATTHTANRDI